MPVVLSMKGNTTSDTVNKTEIGRFIAPGGPTYTWSKNIGDFRGGFQVHLFPCLRVIAKITTLLTRLGMHDLLRAGSG